MPTHLPVRSSNRDVGPRRDSRKNMFLTAILAADGVCRPVRVRNLSKSGALIQAAILPGTGVTATLRRGGLQAECLLVWQADGRAGLNFFAPINLEDWFPGEWVDGEGGDVAPDDEPEHLPPPVADLVAGRPEVEPGLLRRAAAELAFVSRRLEAVDDDLTRDHYVVVRHAASLQELGITMQIVAQLADLLVAERPDEVVRKIGMTDLRRRLQRNSPI